MKDIKRIIAIATSVTETLQEEFSKFIYNKYETPEQLLIWFIEIIVGINIESAIWLKLIMQINSDNKIDIDVKNLLNCFALNAKENYKDYLREIKQDDTSSRH